MAAAIRVVISDFGGVLTTPLAGAFTAYQEHAGIPSEWLGDALEAAAVADGGRHPLYELERGSISEADFFARVEAHLPEPRRLTGFREVYFENLLPNERTIDHLRELRSRGLRLAMLTNNVREWESLWRAKIPDVEELFEVIVDSAFVGTRKPEPEIYEIILDRLGPDITAEDCLFLDDLEVNCEAARSLGMVAVRFEDPDQAARDIEAALS